MEKITNSETTVYFGWELTITVIARGVSNVVMQVRFTNPTITELLLLLFKIFVGKAIIKEMK